MVTNTIKYGLRLKNTGEILKCDMEPVSYEAEFSVGIIHRLSTYGSYDWLVDNVKTAQNAMVSTPDYNADYNTPTHNYSPDQLEVIRLHIQTWVEVETAFSEIFNVKLRDDAKSLRRKRYKENEVFGLYNKDGTLYREIPRSELIGTYPVTDYNEHFYELAVKGASLRSPIYLKKEDYEIVK